MKPPYGLPTMAEINATPPNGFNVVSTFSGAGGSCLGWRMAGFNVIWANEFIPAAQEVYRANHPHGQLDTRDIRTLQPEDILQAIGAEAGEIDVLDGSPPCAAFSTAGKREKSWGQVKAYSETTQRVDDLFFEFARLLRGLQPKTFIAENVSGLVKGTSIGYFKLILRELKDCGYKVDARLCDAQWLGVPQMRQRLIFAGVRNDLAPDPAHPKPLQYRYTIGDAMAAPFHNDDTLCWKMPAGSKTKACWQETKAGARGGMSEAGMKLFGKETMMQHYRLGLDHPANTVCQGSVCLYHWEEPRTLTIAELKRVCSFPDDFQLAGKFKQQWERLGRAVPPVMMSHIASAVRDEVLCKLQ